MKISCLPFLTIFLSARLGALASTNLNVTVVGAANGTSRFEYWELTAPFDTSAQTGIVGTGTTSLGNVANITYNVIPAGFDSGLHNAPYNQYVFLLSSEGKNVLVWKTVDSHAAGGLLCFKESQ